MSLRLSVTYPATDGSMPESVEMEWDDTPSLAGLMPLLERLLTAPQGRATYAVVGDRDRPLRRQSASREDGT